MKIAKNFHITLRNYGIQFLLINHYQKSLLLFEWPQGGQKEFNSHRTDELTASLSGAKTDVDYSCPKTTLI